MYHAASLLPRIVIGVAAAAVYAMPAGLPIDLSFVIEIVRAPLVMSGVTVNVADNDPELSVRVVGVKTSPASVEANVITVSPAGGLVIVTVKFVEAARQLPEDGPESSRDGLGAPPPPPPILGIISTTCPKKLIARLFSTL